MSRYLISGANGFIGGNLGHKLLLDGHIIRSIPRDLLSEKWNLKKYIESEQPDVIIHLAAYGNHSTQQDFLETIESNVMVSSRLLEASKDIDYKAFINISTSSVYLPVQTFYSASKKAIELICQAFIQKYNKNIVTIRPYSVYGPGEADFRFIPTVIRSVKNNQEFSLVSDPKHDWIFIDDFIDGVKLVINKADKLKGCAVDIGTGLSYSNKQIVDLIEQIHGKKIKYSNVSQMRDYDTKHWTADTSVTDFLGLKPKYSLKDGLKKTYESY